MTLVRTPFGLSAGFAGLQPTETVTRPDPGLARGRWEAPAWAFWVALAVIVVGTTLYVLRRMGKLRLGRGDSGKP